MRLHHSPSLTLLLVVLQLLSLCMTGQAVEVRVKDVTSIEGERTNLIWGYGLVSGLAGTGGKSPVTREFATDFLINMGHRLTPNLRDRISNDAQRKTNNLSVVYVMAELPVNARPGQKLDVMVAAYDDASSLVGGALMFTTLLGVDGNIYATAAGPITLGGGFVFGGAAANVQKNHPTSGYVAEGATVERETPIDCHDPSSLRLLLTNADWTTAQKLSDAINAYSADSAVVESNSAVLVRTPAEQGERARFISEISQLPITPDTAAKVVINDRTGTAIFGGNVRVSKVAISHGSLSIITGETPVVSQPAPFSQGETTVVPRTEIDVTQEKRPITLMDDTTSISDLIDGLNALGVAPGDISAIIKQLHAAGALQAHLEFR